MGNRKINIDFNADEVFKIAEQIERNGAKFYRSAAEKDSIVFYLGMKDVVPAHLGTQKPDDIIGEEMGHMGLLSKELIDLKK